MAKQRSTKETKARSRTKQKQERAALNASPWSCQGSTAPAAGDAAATPLPSTSCRLFRSSTCLAPRCLHATETKSRTERGSPGGGEGRAFRKAAGRPAWAEPRAYFGSTAAVCQRGRSFTEREKKYQKERQRHPFTGLAWSLLLEYCCTDITNARHTQKKRTELAWFGGCDFCAQSRAN